MESRYSQHISQEFNQELEGIRSRVMAKGGRVEQQLNDAIAALVHGDLEAARRVHGTDWQINRMEVELDETCTYILARRQPTASDLRLVMAVIKTITDLERIGDEADRIARMALQLYESEEHLPVPAEMETLAAHVRRMLHAALDAFVRMDSVQAVQVARDDMQADSQYEAIMRELVDQMQREPRSVPQLMALIWAARSLERIGDRAGNICEYVVYFVKGKDIRHTSYEQMAESAGFKIDNP